jgi:hypothetical protein
LAGQRLPGSGKMSADVDGGDGSRFIAVWAHETRRQRRTGWRIRGFCGKAMRRDARQLRCRSVFTVLLALGRKCRGGDFLLKP